MFDEEKNLIIGFISIIVIVAIGIVLGLMYLPPQEPITRSAEEIKCREEYKIPVYRLIHCG